MERHTEHSHEHRATSATENSEAGDAYVTISDAARLTGASRTRLYRYVESGKIERSADGKLSVQALLNAGFDIKERGQATSPPSDHLSYLLTHYSEISRQLHESLEDQIDALHKQLSFLQEQLRLSQQREAQLLQLLQRGDAEPVATEHRTHDALRGESQDAAADAKQRMPFANQAAGGSRQPMRCFPKRIRPRSQAASLAAGGAELTRR